MLRREGEDQTHQQIENPPGFDGRVNQARETIRNRRTNDGSCPIGSQPERHATGLFIATIPHGDDEDERRCNRGFEADDVRQSFVHVFSPYNPRRNRQTSRPA